MKAYLTISHGSNLLGTLRLTLRPDIVPKTVDNFVHFLTNHNNNNNNNSNNGQGYQNSTFHRIIPNFMAQGGDFLNHNGTGSTSLYNPNNNNNNSNGGGCFPDENFHLSHSQRGTLSMANSGKDTNGCQFFITFRATSHLDGRHVVFGYVDWREDEESQRVLDGLEKVRTGRGRGGEDRPLEVVRIVDCGLIEENSKQPTRSSTGGGVVRGQAKMNKLMQAYGEVNPAADDDEIDLDDDNDDDDEDKDEDEQEKEKGGKPSTDNGNNPTKRTKDTEEIDLDEGEDQDHEPTTTATEIITAKPNSKKAQLQKRLAALRKKITQSRNLNRREVHAEAARLGTDEASAKERKRLSKQDRKEKEKEYDTYVIGKLKEGDNINNNNKNKNNNNNMSEKQLASLSQPAYESMRQMHAKAERKERSQHGPDDYYNPEGQHSNYERNLKSIQRYRNPTRGAASSLMASAESYDPTMTTNYNHNNTNIHAAAAASSNEKEGAKRLANEMKRRAEKRANAKRKPDFDAYDVSYINDRNKRFNEKISRNFDEHTAEIRQNLERGTAL